SVHETTLREAARVRDEENKRAESNARIAEGQRAAAEANERTEELRKNNLLLQADILKLRSRTEFRHLTPEQQQRVRDKMKRFAGIEFQLATFNSGDDASV